MAKDDFDDVPEHRFAQFGALGGEGAAALEKTSTKVAPEGIVTHCACSQCGAPNIVTVEWLEAIIGGCNALPDGWKSTAPGILSPYEGVACRCQYWVELQFTPAELQRYVHTAVQQGFLDAGAVQQKSAEVRARLGQGRPQQPQMMRSR